MSLKYRTTKVIRYFMRYGPFWMDDLEIEIDNTSEAPVWVQIASILAGQVQRRRVKIGERTWSIRQVAEYNKLSITGAAKAFEVLKKKKIVESIPVVGFRVGEDVLKQREKILEKKIKDLNTMAQQMELNKKELIATISSVWDRDFHPSKFDREL